MCRSLVNVSVTFITNATHVTLLLRFILLHNHVRLFMAICDHGFSVLEQIFT